MSTLCRCQTGPPVSNEHIVSLPDWPASAAHLSLTVRTRLPDRLLGDSCRRPLPAGDAPLRGGGDSRLRGGDVCLRGGERRRGGEAEREGA